MANEQSNERIARRNLQTYLRQLAYFDHSLPLVPIDGIKGDNTTEAIRIYQQKAGLPVTGLADLETWEALYSDYLLSLEMQSKPLPFSPFPQTPADYSLSEGDQGFAVTAVQYLLEALSVIYPIKTVEITGIYDENTKDAISEIQARYLLPVTGKTDKLTWNALVRLYDSLSLYE